MKWLIKFIDSLHTIFNSTVLFARVTFFIPSYSKKRLLGSKNLWTGLAITICAINYSSSVAQTGTAKTPHLSENELVKDQLEKLYLHFDKPNYHSGDTIWFKAYLVSQSNELTEHSKVAYVDLVNNQGSILSSIKLPLVAGLGWADIPLDKQLPAGNYRIRAYTNWMRNFSSEHFFQKVIPVSDIFQKQILSTVKFTSSGSKLLATIEYKNIDGSPASSKELNYVVNSAGKRRNPWKIRTDSDGHFEIPIDTLALGTSPQLLASAVIGADTLNKVFDIPVNGYKPFDVQFFPESGELVNNIPTRLGIKVVGPNGLGLNASGYITDNNGARISSFQTEFGGMGMFGINAQTGQTYTAYVVLENGQQKAFPLPKAAKEGFVMTISQDKDNIIVRIRNSAGLSNSSMVSIALEGQDKVYASSQNTLAGVPLVVKFSKSDLPTGILNVKLSSTTNTPLAERLVFINKPGELSLNLDLPAPSYPVKSKLSSKLKVTDINSKAVLGSFSLAIVDESRVPANEDDEVTILSELLLSSELRGFVEKPNYYFTDDSEEKARHLDMLMMTQGWRRINQKTPVAQKSGNTFFQAEQSLAIKGKVVTALNAPVAGARITLLIPGYTQQLYNTVADEKGEFTFDSLYFENRAKLTLTAKNAKGNSNVKILLDSLPKLEVVKAHALASDILASLDQKVLNEFSNEDILYLKKSLDLTKMQMLNEVVVRGIAKRKVEHSNNLNGRDAQHTFLANQLKNYVSIADAIQGKVPGMTIKNGLAVLTRKEQSLIRGAAAMEVYLDGVPMGTSLADYNINDIEAVEVLTGSGELAIYGTKGASGIILLTTKRGQPERTPPMNQLMVTATGFAPERQFYVPRYDNPQTEPTRDQRSTIYWNPNILTKDGESTEISFYTAQKPGRYRFTIEGVDEFGRLARKVFTKMIE